MEAAFLGAQAWAPLPLLHLVVRSENAPHTLRKHTCLYFYVKLGANFLRTAVTRRRVILQDQVRFPYIGEDLSIICFSRLCKFCPLWGEIFQASLPRDVVKGS